MDRLDFTLAELKFASGDEAPARAFSGYGAVFGNLDSYGDVIAKGAFKRTLRDYRQADRLPPMLAQHGGFLSAADLMPIGVWTKMVEDDTGLVVEGRLSDTARGNEAYTLLKDGALSGLSIGYVTKEFALGTRPGEPRRTIKDIDLLEVSLVTFPANDRARIDQVKAAARSLSTTDWRDLEGALRDEGLSHRDAKKAASALKNLLLRDAGDADGVLRDEAAAADLVASLEQAANFLSLCTKG